MPIPTLTPLALRLLRTLPPEAVTLEEYIAYVDEKPGVELSDEQCAAVLSQFNALGLVAANPAKGADAATWQLTELGWETIHSPQDAVAPGPVVLELEPGKTISTTELS